MRRLLLIPLGAALALWPTQAPAHDAPSGWTYDFACCSSVDCREVPASSIRETAKGYVVPSGEEFPKSRVRESPDDGYHWCSVGGLDTGKTLCLYVPPASF